MMRLIVRSAVVLIVGIASILAAPIAKAQSAAAPGPESPIVAPLPQTPELEEAAKILRSGDFDKTMKALQAAIQKNPELPPAQVIIAGWLAAAGQMSMVRSILEQAVLGAPNDPEAYAALGELAMRNHEVVEASLLFDKAYGMTRSLKDPNARLRFVKRHALAGLAAVAVARQDWAGAQTQYEALIAEDPKDSSAIAQLGQVLYMQKKEDLALAKFREAAKLNPNLFGAEATLAQLYQQAGDVKNAGKWMVEAIRLNPRDAKTRIAAAQWSYEIGKLDQAEEQAKAAVQLDPDSLNSRLIRGLVALLRKDFKTAQEFYEKAHLQAPSNFVAMNNLALALVSQDDELKKRLAMEYAQINARVFSDKPEAFSTLGWVLYRLGRAEEAEATLRKAISSPRPSPDAYYFLARLYVDRGQKEEAKMLLSQVVKSPTSFLMRKEAETLAEELGGR